MRKYLEILFHRNPFVELQLAAIRMHLEQQGMSLTTMPQVKMVVNLWI